MKNAVVVRCTVEQSARAPRIKDPENFTVLHAIKKAKARREAKEPRSTAFNPIRGLERLTR